VFTPTTLVTSIRRDQGDEVGADVIYKLRGTFIEACDCFELCPCWVDDDPDEGHCTGLVAWAIRSGEIDGVDVSRCRVVAITTHSGRRRPDGAGPSRATTALFVDSGTRDDQVEVLTRAFSGGEGEGLADLVQVTGRVVGETQKVDIDLVDDDAGWSIRVGTPRTPVVEVQGGPLTFDDSKKALTLNHTALHKELHIGGPVEAKRSENMTLNVPALGGSGYVAAKARSGMSGKFTYESA
jgi:hypothetical protein